MVSPRVLATGATAVALSLGGSAPVAAQPSAPANVPALLALPASPGTIARLVEHAGHVDVQQRLSEALTHSDPTVRAAAARVVFVVGLRGLVPRLAEVLVSESQPDPAIELTRALANFGGPEHDGVIDGAAVRLGSRPGVRVASVFAAARGADALAALPRFRAADGGRAVAALIRAARPGGAALAALVDDALGTSDLAVFEAALAVARDRGEDVGEERVRAALEHRAPEIRLEAVLHVLRSWDGERPLSAALRAALGTDAPLGTASAGVSARLARDLAHRAAGKAVASTFDWKALAASNSPQVEALVSLASTQRLLTDRERQGAREAFPHLGSNRRPTPPAAGSAAPLTQALEVYPQGFVAGVLSATRCDIGKARRQGLGLGAGLLTLRRDGRAARLSPVDTGVVQDACVAATRILLMTHVAETPLPAENQRRVVVAPFDPDYVTCKESPPDYRPLSYASASSYLDPPKKTRHVNPIYPPGALRDRVQGVVVVEALIGTTGCVREASVAQGIDSRLDLAALRAVLGWRFTPTLIDGTPTPVTMQVTVQFTAQ